MLSKNLLGIIGIFFTVVLVSSIASAGVGIKWGRESALAEGGEKACLTYEIYNPWDEDTYVDVGVSDELKNVLILQDVEATLIPAHTSSDNSIPIEFCFEVPKGVYQKDCWVGGFFVCEQECKEDQRVYEGEVEVSSVPNPAGGGSAAIMAVSAPLRVKVACTPHKRNYSLLYVLIGLVAAVAIYFILKYRKPKDERLREQMKALKEKLKAGKK